MRAVGDDGIDPHHPSFADCNVQDQEDRAPEDRSLKSYPLSPLVKGRQGSNLFSAEASSVADSLPSPMRPLAPHPAFVTGRPSRSGGSLFPSYQGTKATDKVKPQTPSMPYIPVRPHYKFPCSLQLNI
eukprot:468031-Prorocentrum_minimum.AAC.4